MLRSTNCTGWVVWNHVIILRGITFGVGMVALSNTVMVKRIRTRFVMLDNSCANHSTNNRLIPKKYS